MDRRVTPPKQNLGSPTSMSTGPYFCKNNNSARASLFCGTFLYRQSSRREDPEVRIELPIEADVFSCDLGRATKSNFQIAETEKKNCSID